MVFKYVLSAYVFPVYVVSMNEISLYIMSLNGLSIYEMPMNENSMYTLSMNGIPTYVPSHVSRHMWAYVVTYVSLHCTISGRWESIKTITEDANVQATEVIKSWQCTREGEAGDFEF